MVKEEETKMRRSRRESVIKLTITHRAAPRVQIATTRSLSTLFFEPLDIDFPRDGLARQSSELKLSSFPSVHCAPSSLLVAFCTPSSLPLARLSRS